MNLSGASVLVARDFYKIEHSDILVICDDFQIPLDSIRLHAVLALQAVKKDLRTF